VFAGSATTFLGFTWPVKSWPAPYASFADAFLFPSSTETLGLVLLERHSGGLPAWWAPTAAHPGNRYRGGQRLVS